MAKSKKVQMPAGIRNKLMAAVAMLLVSSIMMVSSTYAWFTLSTAPEVTGITTSVGANGNLEIALLNTETYEGKTTISSAVGTSIAASGDVTTSNITWGNLVDLSHSSYGLNLIALNPAAPNHPVSGEGTSATTDTTKVLTTNLLQTAEYGSDGRVTKLTGNTVSGIYDSTSSKWIVEKDIGTDGTVNKVQTRGVRAIGVDSNMSTAQIVFNAAKAEVVAGKTGAANAVSAAVNANKNTFVDLLNKADGVAYTDEELTALTAVADGIQTSLNTIVKTYSNAVLATLAAEATNPLSDEVLSDLRGKLSGNTDAAKVSEVLTAANVSVDATLTSRLGELKTAQATVKSVITYLDTTASTSTAPADIKTNVVSPLIGGSADMYAVNKDNQKVDLQPSNVSVITAIYVGGGLLGTIAEDAGTYRLTTYLGYPVYGSKVTTNATTENPNPDPVIVTPVTNGNLVGIASTVSGLTAPSSSGAESTIVDFYGYIIDFAFRTNAADSFLQLQTTAANRVYTDGGAGTMGAGSTVTFNYSADMSNEQAEKLLGAVKLMFINPTDGTIYATAKLSNVQIAESGNIATAEVVLETTTATAGTATSILPLNQNQTTKVSVMVYLDGYTVDNSVVANGSSSGILNLNLQFSSSAELVPMENSALKNMAEAESFAVKFDANGGSGTASDVAVKAGRSYVLPTTANGLVAPTGMQFKGWSTVADGSNMVTTITVSADTTVYAIWENATAAEPEDPVLPEDDETNEGDPVTMNAVSSADENTYTIGSASYVDNTISFTLLNEGDSTAITSGAAQVAIDGQTFDAVAPTDGNVWTVEVSDITLAAGTAVTVTYTP